MRRAKPWSLKPFGTGVKTRCSGRRLPGRAAAGAPGHTGEPFKTARGQLEARCTMRGRLCFLIAVLLASRHLKADAPICSFGLRSYYPER